MVARGEEVIPLVRRIVECVQNDAKNANQLPKPTWGFLGNCHPRGICGQVLYCTARQREIETMVSFFAAAGPGSLFNMVHANRWKDRTGLKWTRILSPEMSKALHSSSARMFKDASLNPYLGLKHEQIGDDAEHVKRTYCPTGRLDLLETDLMCGAPPYVWRHIFQQCRPRYWFWVNSQTNICSESCENKRVRFLLAVGKVQQCFQSLPLLPYANKWAIEAEHVLLHGFFEFDPSLKYKPIIARHEAELWGTDKLAPSALVCQKRVFSIFERTPRGTPLF
jgi:hypothetical protein